MYQLLLLTILTNKDMKKHIVRLEFFRDEADGDYGLAHEKTIGLNESFNAFWNGIGIFHDVFEYDFDKGVDLFKEMGLVASGSYVSYYNFSASGYCCDDCDGDYEVYKKGQYKRYVIDRMIDDIKKQLTNNKKKYYEINK